MSVVEKYMRDQGFTVFPQVPLKTRHIDLVCVRHGGREIMAIELKVKNWRRAFQQALGYRLCADTVYVALWHEYVHRAQGDLLRKYGIGLLKVDSSVEVVQLAAENGFVQRSLREDVESYLVKNGSHERSRNG